jgi:hypothetical protein
MQVSSHWRTASLVAGALVVGTVIGPPLAQAASSTLVRIEGGHSTHVAAVSKTGELSVNAGLTTTPAGQVKVALASPADAVVVVGTPHCPAGEVYNVPAGKALVITSVTFLNLAVTSGTPHTLELVTGPVATPCFRIVAIAGATQGVETHTQAFNPGIPVPAGDALGISGSNDDGDVLIYGYLVPAAAVPASVLKRLPAAVPGGLPTVKPAH